jgi:excisionase family DNA binding protein
MTAPTTLRLTTPEVFTIEQTAGRLGVHRSTVYDLISSGELLACRIRSDYRVPADALLAYLQRAIEPIQTYARPTHRRGSYRRAASGR